MSKIIKAVVLVAVAVAIVVFAPEIAGVLASTLGTTTGIALSAATITALTSTIVAVGLSLGLAAIGSLFRKAPELSSANIDRLNQEIVPTAPRKFIFGTTAAGNDVRFFEIYGDKQDYEVKVVALASHRVSKIKGWYVEADLTWTPESGFVHNQGGFSHFRAQDGTDTSGYACGTQTLWTTSARFTGCSYLIIDYKLDSKAWPQGIPTKTTTIVDGCPLYDPRLDSSRNGNGSHRIDDQSTWQFTSPTTGVAIGRNPALAVLAYLIGWRINGKLAWGKGVSPANINLDNFKAYANICEEVVLALDGTTVQRYTCDGIFSTSDTHETVINGITAAMGSCKLSDVGGAYKFIGGYDDTLGAIVNFDENDLIGGVGSPSPIHWQPAGPTSETYNIASGKFADPTQLYQLATWGEIDTDPLPDGIPRTLTLDLGCVSRPETCQRIAKQWLLREALTPGFLTGTFGPKAFIVEVGSLVCLTMASMGWNAKLFRVQEQHEVHDMIYQMTLREEDAGVYAWDKEEKPLPATIIPQGYDPTMTIMPQGVTLEATTYQGVS